MSRKFSRRSRYSVPELLSIVEEYEKGVPPGRIAIRFDTKRTAINTIITKLRALGAPIRRFRKPYTVRPKSLDGNIIASDNMRRVARAIQKVRFYKDNVDYISTAYMISPIPGNTMTSTSLGGDVFFDPVKPVKKKTGILARLFGWL